MKNKMKKLKDLFVNLFSNKKKSECCNIEFEEISEEKTTTVSVAEFINAGKKDTGIKCKCGGKCN